MIALAALSALAAPATVEIVTDTPDLEVRLTPTDAPRCVGPCTLELDPEVPSLVFGGPRYTTAVHPVQLDDGDRLRLDVDPGSLRASNAGGILGAGAVGLLLVSSISFAVADDRTAAWVMLGGSLTSGLIAWPLVNRGTTRVEVQRP